VAAASQTVRVSGPVGADARLLLVEGAMELFDATGFDIEPFEANTAVVVSQFDAVIGAPGYVDIPVTLTQTMDPNFADSGLNHLVATLVDPIDGANGPVSDVLVLRYDPAACSSDLECDDALFCNGAETCNVVGACEPGLPPAGDGVLCRTTSVTRCSMRSSARPTMPTATMRSSATASRPATRCSTVRRAPRRAARARSATKCWTSARPHARAMRIATARSTWTIPVLPIL
jgi:hypothetical protein